jgi:hypothetical protein
MKNQLTDEEKKILDKIFTMSINTAVNIETAKKILDLYNKIVGEEK